MPLIVLHSLGRERDHAKIELNLVPTHFGDFIATLSGQNQQSNNAPVVIVARAIPNDLDFVVAEEAFSRHLLHLLGEQNRIVFRPSLFHRPLETSQEGAPPSVYRRPLALAAGV